MSFVPKKLYYKIREVCDIVGVDAHVLRFWESEFPALAPPKSKTGQRTYRPKDIELLLRIKKLLYEEGFTIAGARKRLSTGSGEAESAVEDSAGAAAAANRVPGTDRLRAVRRELEKMLTLLDGE